MCASSVSVLMGLASGCEGGECVPAVYLTMVSLSDPVDSLRCTGVCPLMDGRYLLCLVVSKLPSVCSQLQLL